MDIQEELILKKEDLEEMTAEELVDLKIELNDIMAKIEELIAICDDE